MPSYTLLVLVSACGYSLGSHLVRCPGCWIGSIEQHVSRAMLIRRIIGTTVLARCSPSN